MIIRKYKCNNCNVEHERKTYENISEGTADIFTESYFIPIWDKMKDRIKEISIEDFCKELVFTAVYHYHKNRRRIKVEKSSIEYTDGAEDQTN